MTLSNTIDVVAFPGTDFLAVPPAGSLTFERVNLGQWVLGTSTPDEPVILTVKSAINYDGESRYTFKYDQRKNNPVPGQPDVRQQIWTTIVTQHRHFTNADIDKGAWAVQRMSRCQPILNAVFQGRR